MKKFVMFGLAAVLMFSLSVGAFAASTEGDSGGASTGTDVLTDLTSGWYDTDYGYKTGYLNSWFWQLLLKVRGIFTSLNDLKTSWTSSSYPTGYSGSWFQQVLVSLRNISSGASSWTTSQATTVTSDVGTMQDDVSESKNSLSRILTAVQSLDASNWTASNVTGIVSDVDSIELKTNDIRGYSQSIKVNTDSIDSSVNDVESKLDTSNSYLYSLKQYLLTIRNAVNDLKTVFASSNALTAHNNQTSNASTVVSGFLSGASSGSSLGASDFSGVKDALSSTSGLLSSPASLSDFSDSIDTAYGDDGAAFGFFSQSVSDELNGVTPSRSFRSSSESVSYPYFDAERVKLNNWLGGGPFG